MGYLINSRDSNIQALTTPFKKSLEMGVTAILDNPLNWYADKTALRFHLLGVGEGLMTLIIFPNGVVMLFDCNVTEDNESRVLEFLGKHIPAKYNSDNNRYEQPIEIFANSHRDEDHYRGLRKVNKRFPIKSIWDSGQSGATTSSQDYSYYMYLRRCLKDEDQSNLLVPVPSNVPVANIGGAAVFCLAAENDFVKDYVKESLREMAKVQHTNSMVLSVSYADRRLLLTGDSDWKSWRDKIVPNFEDDELIQSDILVASHHGSRSFFTDEMNDSIDDEANPDTTYTDSIKLIQPHVTLISCGGYKTAHHPNKDALKLYKAHTSGSQVYSTFSKGTFSGYIDAVGNFTVVPARFRVMSNAPPSIGFNIRCTVLTPGSQKDIESGSQIRVGCCSLVFSIDSRGGLIEPIDQVDVYWEVSNGGQGSDDSHHEIYSKGTDEQEGLLSFRRDLSYVGTHLLRCRVRNRKKRYDVTKVFVVHGI